MAAILASGPVQTSVDQLIWFDRDGGRWPVWFTYCRSPIREADGRIVALLVTAADTSDRVLAARRLRFNDAFDAVARSAQSLDDVMCAGVRLLGEALDAGRAAYGEIDVDAQTLAVRASWSRGDMPELDGVIAVGGFGEEADRLHYQGIPMRVTDAATDPRLVNAGPSLAALGLRAALSVPIRSAGRLAAVIFVHEPTPRHWLDADVELATAAALRISHAVEQARTDAALRAANNAKQDALAAVEAERNEAASLYEAFFNNTSDAVFVLEVTADGRFVFERTNPANAINNGFSTALVRGKTAFDLFPPDTATTLEANYRRCLETGETQHYTEGIMMPGGHRHFETSLVPLRDATGRITRIWGGGRHITDRVRLEEALRQGQKMQALGQLAGGIAHDFNNLLGAIIGSLDLVQRRTDLDDRVRRYVGNAFAAAERGAKLTGQLLAFARAQRLELRPVIAADLIEGMRDLLARTLGPHIALHFDLKANRAPVLTGATQLEMAILNLAINARDAMPDGGTLSIHKRLVTVTNDPDLVDGDYVEIVVADTGHGMPAEIAARAFDPFFTTKRIGEGTGLGLSQVYGIAHQAGGIARIETAAGKGTKVLLYLRRVMGTETSSPALASAGAVKVRPLKVLVVDDDQQMRRFLADSLEMLGHQVTEAGDGADGIAKLGAVAPDIMIVDFALPDINGAEVAREAWARRPELPLVFASGFSDTQAIQEVAGDSVAVLRKPFGVDELQAAIAAALAR